MDLNLNKVPFTPPTEQVVEQNTEVVQDAPVVDTGTPTPPPAQEPPKAEPPKVDVFFEEFNKRFGTQYKADDDIKNVVGLPKKVVEYETRLKESEAQVKSIDDYKKKITELEESQDPLKYFSSPDSYIAEQLKIKYPKSNPDILHKIATTDLTKMDDLDVLVKDKQLFVPDAPKEGIIRSVVLKKYGIDPTTPPEEWDEISVGEMKLDAAAARDKINGLKGVIEMPKIITKEQREQQVKEAMDKKVQALEPIKQNFSKFDKFSKDGFEFDVPEDFKSKVPDIFEAFFVNANMEPTQENIEAITELRDSQFLYQNFAKIKEVIAKEAETKSQAKIDAELHNTQPPNTATATDQGEVDPFAGHGLSKFLQDQKRR
jgi:hypothetical protein